MKPILGEICTVINVNRTAKITQVLVGAGENEIKITIPINLLINPILPVKVGNLYRIFTTNKEMSIHVLFFLF